MSSISSKNRIKIAEQILFLTQKFEKSTLQSFIVYGSTAQGKANKESDLDIQILVNVSTPSFVNYLSKLKATIEQKYNLEIALNIKTVSEFIVNIQRSEPLYYFMLTDGICLLDSTVFQGLKHFLKAYPKPLRPHLEKVHAKGIQIRSETILKKLVPSFIQEFQSILEGYNHLERTKEKSIQASLDKSLEKHKQVYIPISLKGMYKDIEAIANFKNNSYKLDTMNEFSLIDLLSILNTILQETNAYIHE